MTCEHIRLSDTIPTHLTAVLLPFNIHPLLHKLIMPDTRVWGTDVDTTKAIDSFFCSNEGLAVQEHGLRTVPNMLAMTDLYLANNPNDEEVKNILKDPLYKRGIMLGSLLHDIGKMNVDPTILRYPGELTREERIQIETHPAFAKTLLEKSPNHTRALEIPYSHHEKWNGTGYPRGLFGLSIPLLARIFTVADVWDALTSVRPYQHAWTEIDANRHINSLSGTSFDPKVVDIFNIMCESKLLSTQEGM